MQIGLYFGSYNPIHIGHLAIAGYMAQFSDLDQVWLVVSPQNPLKDKQSLLQDRHRLAMVNEAIEDIPYLRSSDIEFQLPKPSYTIHTLTYLKEKYPQHQFSLIMGGDNLASFHKWKNYEQILAEYRLYVYPRPGYESCDLLQHPSVTIIDAPLMELSSTMIRQAVKQKKDVRCFMPVKAWEYMREMHFYEK
jgi:nicotinate-nucleotide adenylyltransferase